MGRRSDRVSQETCQHKQITIFSGLRIEYEFYIKHLMKKTLLVLVAFICCSFNLLCAQTLLKGIVKSEKGYPVKEATIAVEGTHYGTMTDNQGRFELSIQDTGSLILRVHSFNYQDKRVSIDKIADKHNISIVLPDKAFNLSEVVVTGTGTHTYLKDTPIHTQIFTQKEIQNTGSTSLEEIVANMNSSVTYSESHGIIASGLGGRNLLILVDGNKMNGDTSGQTDLERIDMSKIKRIEIIRGSASVLYGSEAMGGVINIITQNPTEKVNITTTNKISRKGQFFHSTVAEFKLGKVTSQTSYQRRQTNGWQLSPYEWDKKGGPNKNGYDENGQPTVKETVKQAVTAYSSNIVKQKFTYKPNARLSFDLFGSYYNKKQDRPYEAYSYNMAYKDYNIGAGTIYRLPKKIGFISFDTYFDNYEYEKDHFKGKKEGTSELSKRQRYFKNDLKSVLNFSHHKLTTGLDYTIDYLANPEKLEHSKSAYTAAVYAQDEMKFFDAWTVVAGFRALHHKEFNNRFVPSLSTMYSWDHVNMRLSYAGGFRAPDMMELYYENENMNGGTVNHPNPNLKPEKSNSFSFNAEYFNNFFTLSGSAYITFVDDIIQRVLINDQYTNESAKQDHYQYQNYDRARSRGFDVSMQFLLTEGLTLGTNYSFLEAKNMNSKNKPNVRDKYLNGSSRHTGSVSLNYFKNWSKYDLNVNLNGHLQSRAYYTNMDARSYNLWNITSTHRFKALSIFTPEVSLGIDNIFNFKDEKPFLMRYATTSPGRTFFASVTLKFNK